MQFSAISRSNPTFADLQSSGQTKNSSRCRRIRWWIGSDREIYTSALILRRFAHVLYSGLREVTTPINRSDVSIFASFLSDSPLFDLLLIWSGKYLVRPVQWKNIRKIGDLWIKSSYLKEFEYNMRFWREASKSTWNFLLWLTPQELESGSWLIRALRGANRSISRSTHLALFPRFSNSLFSVLFLKKYLGLNLHVRYYVRTQN